jgi:hypothetical protein
LQLLAVGEFYEFFRVQKSPVFMRLLALDRRIWGKSCSSALATPDRVCYKNEVSNGVWLLPVDAGESLSPATEAGI